MAFNSILLIAAVATIALIMYRVGRDCSKAAQAHAASSQVPLERHSQADVPGRESDAQAEDGAARKRRGCC